MDVLRTPDERFEGLADWPYAPRYTEITDADGTRLRVHHVDEGPRGQRPILLMHGEPSWAYLYRKIIADLVARGRRAVAPDLVGFGRSDKPTRRGDYTYERHVAWMSDWLVRNDLKDIVLFCQDWGGLIGLRLVAAFPERFAAVVVSNTGLPIGQGKTEGFEAWLNFSQNVPELPIGFILNGGTARDLSSAPPMTRPSQPKATRKARVSFRPWCRSRPSTPRSPRTRPPGRFWSASTSRS